MFITNLTREYLFNKFSQESIFNAYGVPITNKLFCSPYRSDKNPTVKLKYHNNILYYHDNGDINYKGLDCVNLVMRIKNLSYHNSLKDIYLTMNGKNNDISSLEAKDRVWSTLSSSKGRKTIKLNFKDFNDRELEYWQSYGITIDILNKYNVKSIKECYIQNNSLEWFNCKKKDELAFAYLFPDGSIKSYFPERVKYYRFISNSTYLSGYEFIPENTKTLIITKSYKDVICYSLFGITAVSYQSESILPSQELINTFDCIYTSDNDWQGKKSALKIRKTYNIPILMFNKEYKAMGIKDFADACKILSKEELLNLVQKTKHNL